jgi:magnesium transporter
MLGRVAEYLNQPVRAFASADFTALGQNLSVGDALAQIRERGVAPGSVYFYVVDAGLRLVGIMPTRQLLTAPLDARLADIMNSRVVTIPDTATVLEACEMFVLHKFLAFPVVDAEQRLMGAVDVNLFTEQVFDLSEKERMDDVFQTIGFHVAEVQNASPVKAFRLRFPWLVATLTAGIVCALMATLFETTLVSSIILAFFLTLVLGLGEGVSAQSVTVTVQALRGRRPDRAWFTRAIRREFVTALMLGGTCGCVVGLITWLWRGSGAAALVIGGSIALSMLIACLIGLTVPTLLHRFKLDPRIAAGPVSLALADIFTLLIYFNLATFIL